MKYLENFQTLLFDVKDTVQHKTFCSHVDKERNHFKSIDQILQNVIQSLVKYS